MPLWHDRRPDYTDAKRDGVGNEPSHRRKDTRAEKHATRKTEAQQPPPRSRKTNDDKRED